MNLIRLIFAVNKITPGLTQVMTRPRNTAVREVFSRDTQRDMGQPYTRSRYYHLYLNGMYWGLYQTEERPESHYGASYFGGNKDDYDVIKVNSEGSLKIEATDGNLLSWQKIYDLSTTLTPQKKSNKNREAL